MDLLSSSARAVVTNREALVTLTEAITDAGYTAEVIDVSSSLRAADDVQQFWKVDYAVGGMTCASCVGNVEKAVDASWSGQHPGVEMVSFDVSLMDGRATAKFQGTSKESVESATHQVMEAIEDAGYEVEISGDGIKRILESTSRSHAADTRRAVQIRIDGMFCPHCIDKVKDYLEDRKAQAGNTIQVSSEELAGLSISHPSVAVSYIPSLQTPVVTLRGMLADISALDPAFSPSEILPPSLSSRSAIYAQKELYGYIIRLAVSAVFVVPVLLLGVIAPTLLSPSHPLRIRLAQPIWGGASIGEVSLWALATPVQFGVGSLFYSRAFKNLRSVWRPGRHWSERLMRWGSMDTLIALGTSTAYFSSLVFLFIDVARGSNGAEGESMTYFDASVFLFCEYNIAYSYILR